MLDFIIGCLGIWAIHEIAFEYFSRDLREALDK